MSITANAPQLRFLGLACIVAAVGCSSGGSGGPVGVVGVVSATPENGAVDVASDATVTVRLASELTDVLPGDLTVHEGSISLPGTFVRMGGGSGWVWAPDFPMPRGATLQVRARTVGSQQVITSFGVQEARVESTFQLPVSIPTAAWSWPNGRRAVSGAGRLFEVDQGGWTERFVDIPRHARAVGDGQFIYSEYDPISGAVCVRSSLAGMEDRVPIPGGQLAFDNNANGDALVVVSGSQVELWLLRRDSLNWLPITQLPAFESIVSAELDDAGDLAFRFLRNGRLHWTRMMLSGQSAAASPIHELAEPGVLGGSIGTAADGSGMLTWLTEDVPGRFDLRVAHFDPVTGFRVVLQPAAVWNASEVPQLGASIRIANQSTSGAGSSLVSVALGLTAQRLEVVPVMADGLGLAPVLSLQPGPLGPMTVAKTVSSSYRGETWVTRVSEDEQRVLLRRIRPGVTSALERTLYTVSQSDRTVLSYQLAVCDTGQAVLAVKESRAGAQGAQILVID